jgi:hypothetical protein
MVKISEELHMTIDATPNEVIALNAAIHYYLVYFHQETEEFHLTRDLLLRFRQRLVERLPAVTEEARKARNEGIGGQMALF